MKYLLVIFLLANSRAFPQTVDDIINKHFEATGGKEKWEKVYSLHHIGNYVMGPGMLAPVTYIAVSKPFRGLYSDFSWQGMSSKTAMRGDSGWRYNPFGGKRETDPLSAEDIRRLKIIADPQGLLYNYAEKGCTIDYLGTDDMDGTDVYKLRLTTKEGDMIYYYIDAETYYVLETETRLNFKDKEKKSYSVYSDFRETDFGIIVPFSSQNVDKNGNEEGGPVNDVKVEVNAPLDATLFDKPKTVNN